MRSARKELALEKERLVERAALCRLRLAADTRVLRGSLQWSRIASSAAMAPGSRAAVVAIALSLPMIVRAVRFAVTAVRLAVIAKLALSLFGSWTGYPKMRS